VLLQKLAHSFRFDVLLNFFIAVVIFSSIKITSVLAFKIRQGCVPPGRFVFCFDRSA